MESKIKKVFIGIQLVIYIIFMYLDIFYQSYYIASNYLKFSSIVVCVLYVIISFHYRHRDLDRWLLLLAILFTLMSDWFIIIHDYYNYGLITFIVVQYLYLIRILHHNKRLTIPIFINKLFINMATTSCIILILLFTQVEVDKLALLSIFYFVTFVMNVIQGMQQLQKGKDAFCDTSFLLFLVGIILFLMCDINVGIYNFTSYLSIKGNWFISIEKFSAVAMWMFYLPSQVIISISNLSKEQ